MVEASRKIVCIFVDCNWGKKNKELSDRFQVDGYPTVIFCDPDGKVIEHLRSRDAAGVQQQILEIVEKYQYRPSFTDNVTRAQQDARKASKPLAIYFLDDSAASVTVNRAFLDDGVKELLGKFVFATAEVKKGSDECARFGVTSAPAIVVVDASREKPEEKPLARISGSRSAKELRKELENALLPGAAEAPKAPPPSAAEAAWVFHLKSGGKLKVVSYEDKDEKYLLKLVVGGSSSVLKEDVEKIVKAEPGKK